MISSTLRVFVDGDSYDEIIEKAEKEISDFMEIDVEEISKKVNYELLISKTEDMSSDTEYQAEVIARIKGDNRV